jgi:hypothetical protein
VTPNNRFERSRGCTFGEPRREWIEINCLRLTLAKLRVAQPHRRRPFASGDAISYVAVVKTTA